MADIKFVGRVTKGNFENQFKFGFKLADLPQPNANGYINLLICKSKDKDTWYAKVDNWQPKPQDIDAPENSEKF